MDGSSRYKAHLKHSKWTLRSRATQSPKNPDTHCVDLGFKLTPPFHAPWFFLTPNRDGFLIPTESKIKKANVPDELAVIKKNIFYADTQAWDAIK